MDAGAAAERHKHESHPWLATGAGLGLGIALVAATQLLVKQVRSGELHEALERASSQLDCAADRAQTWITELRLHYQAQAGIARFERYLDKQRAFDNYLRRRERQP